jgi:hypothetical protein
MDETLNKHRNGHDKDKVIEKLEPRRAPITLFSRSPKSRRSDLYEIQFVILEVVSSFMGVRHIRRSADGAD